MNCRCKCVLCPAHQELQDIKERRDKAIEAFCTPQMATCTSVKEDLIRSGRFLNFWTAETAQVRDNCRRERKGAE